MKTYVALICFVVSASVGLADAPLPLPIEQEICNKTNSYCAVISLENGSSVYENGNERKKRKIYSIPGWHRDPYLSENGEYFAAGYSGLSLVPLDVNENTIILTIWKRGEKITEVKLGQLLTSMASLQKTVSHYYWGETIGFDKDGSFAIKTVEGNVVKINPKNGEIMANN